MKYRPEIDGLRAVAVTAVILFHAGFGTLPGGFVGVDVFFVISGYLITSLIVEDLSNSRFSFAAFFERRARRLLPALFFVLLCCLPIAASVMLPTQLADFGQSVVAVNLFASNFHFWLSTGYFDPVTDKMPLLHTWSLAVEEQFYLLFPALLLVLWRFGLRVVIGVIAAIALTSLAYSHWASAGFPASNFYLLPSRAWELFAGALCAFYLRDRDPVDNNLLSLLGIGLVLGSAVLLDDQARFPSLLALPVVVGSCLIILYATRETLVGHLLSTRSAVAIGLISYSAYLWHQPLFAFARITVPEQHQQLAILALMPAIFLIAFISWRFVEQPFRKPSHASASPRGLIWGASLAFAGALAASGYVVATKPTLVEGLIPSTNHARVNLALSAKTDKSPNIPCSDGTLRGLGDDLECAFGDLTRPEADFILIGDSFSVAISEALDQSALRNGRRGAYMSTFSCPPFFGIGGDSELNLEKCETMQDAYLESVLRSGASTVYLAGIWGALSPDPACNFSRITCDTPEQGGREVLEWAEKTITAYREHGLTVILIGTPPSTPYDVPETLAMQVKGDDFSDLTVERRPSFWSAQTKDGHVFGAYLLSLMDYFCEGDTCFVSRDGVAFKTDNVHLTNTVALDLSYLFDETMLAMDQSR